MNLFRQTIISFLFLFMCFCVSGQQKRYLQLDFNGGISIPIQGFKSTLMFAGQGTAAGGGFDYFFGKIGLGFNAGYFSNPTSKLFADYIEHKYLEKISAPYGQSWNNIYGMLGPVYKFGYKKFEFDFFIKGGYSQIVVPTLAFNKSFFNQTYDVYRFTGVTEDWQFAWSGGGRLIYKVNHWLGIQTKADYFTTSYISDVSYNNSYRDATDGNRNGVIDDAEYFESQKISNKGVTPVSVVNVSMGLLFQIGRSKFSKPTQMLPERPEPLNDDLVSQVKPVEEVVVKVEDVKIQEAAKTEIPLINAHEAPKEELKKNEENVMSLAVKIEPILETIEIPLTTYDAPEAKYDVEAAQFLYKAGESYFATNDFENALPCFNKLKADVNYPRAKYMFALSLCAMGNCEEAKKEYREFSKTYKGDDKRTLEIIFASHSERCKTTGKITDPIMTKNKTIKEKEDKDKVISGRSYKIQFIAMKKSNANFPRVATVGDIETEFFPNKSVYRYTLGGYGDIKQAATDVYKVRKLGFRDAFVAVYDNGVRVNTIYHSK
ncbi:MAG: hypothetical protein IPO92_10125 [Saprospiraceae bacterium]|nr:hypothetical protein [Saprospiraceae bacterium]